jgi:hypothetical protein
MITERKNEMVRAMFLAAKDGKIEVTLEGGQVLKIESSEDVAFLNGLVDFTTANCSSSMDWAHEYGFSYPSAAWDMLNRGLESL